jgi:hypothetical protein
VSLATLLHQVATVRRRTATVYTDGTPVRGNFAEVAEEPCRVSPGSGGETLTTNSDQRETFRSAVIFFGPDADVLASDTVEVDGVIYEVVYPRLIHAHSAPHHIEVDARVIGST